MEQKPSVGRIVHYRPMVATADNKGQPYPAVITHVFSDTCVNLSVLNDGSHPLSQNMLQPTSVMLGTEPRSWSWPPMVGRPPAPSAPPGSGTMTKGG